MTQTNNSNAEIVAAYRSRVASSGARHHLRLVEADGKTWLVLDIGQMDEQSVPLDAPMGIVDRYCWRVAANDAAKFRGWIESPGDLDDPSSGAAKLAGAIIPTPGLRPDQYPPALGRLPK